jgi:hypothetical protein
MNTPPEPTQRTHQRIIIAHHLIVHGYGHWIPNDPRGSGSDELREDKLKDLGPVHKGRSVNQPSREELRDFYREAAKRLDFSHVWFDSAKRQAVAEAFGETIASQRYTVWACAVLRSHAHICIRRHRDDALTMWHKLAQSARDRLRLFADVHDDHPVWSDRPYKVFLYAPDDVWRVVRYIEGNPAKHGLPAQSWPFVRPYDNWPHRRKKG